MSQKIILYVDGASRGNPGQASFGVVVQDASGNTLEELQTCLGIATNNVAEYQALIHGLRAALARGATQVEVKTDSLLVCQQVKGIYRVKQPHLKTLLLEAVALVKKFESFNISHVARSSCQGNVRADQLANIALDNR